MKCQSCTSCGMPLEKTEDFALGDAAAQFCKYCTDAVGRLLPWETILKGNIDYLKESQGLTDIAAAKMAADLLQAQPAWRHIGN